MIISLISTKFINKSKLGDQKVLKINDVMGLSLTQAFSSKTAIIITYY